MAERPKISIVTPSFNQAEFIEETICSVLDQNYPNLEFFIIDGGSTDDTVSVIKRYEKWIDYWASEPDHGQSDAIQKGFSRCTGELWNWLNSDDVLEIGALNKIAGVYQENPHAAVYAGRLVVFGHDIEEFIYPQCFSSTRDLACVWEAWPVPQPALFLSRTMCVDIGGIDAKLCYGMDYELYLRLTLHPNFSLHSIDDRVAKIRRHPGAKSVSQKSQFRNEILEIFDAFARTNSSVLPKGWRRSRDLFEYISGLQNRITSPTKKISIFNFLQASAPYIPKVWHYRYFWGSLRRCLLNPAHIAQTLENLN